MNTIDETDLDRASEKMKVSEIDPLSKESMERALHLASIAMKSQSNEDTVYLLAKAHGALAVAISHYMIWARTYGTEIARNTVNEQAVKCHDNMDNISNVVKDALKSQTESEKKTPFQKITPAVAIIIGALILKGDTSIIKAIISMFSP